MRNGLVVLALACVLVIGEANETVILAERSDVAGSPAALIEAHGCWTSGEAAAVDPDTLLPVLPSHAVVTVRTGDAPRYVGGRVAARAFEQWAEGVDNGIARIHGWCR